ncbi:hypothetical protein EVU96_17610 [Bacillus infantis]|uniref:hypothetical protein n=1 Tax=Bacillus infantis TaxID=324767 RepID=UPI00101C6988|nr:hypothetical protein [Bacillus infantis]RYI27594.1 hypothetical protein EVU96_17610 [Bacillus infantis]
MILKKVMLLVMGFVLLTGHVSASEILETGEEAEVKDQAAKTFIYESLRVWLDQDISRLYHKKYKADSVEWIGPEREKVRIWIREVKSNPGPAGYTHVIRIFLPYENVIVNNSKEVKSADTVIYAVNARFLSLCPESGKSEKEIKLLRTFHKVLSNTE